MNAAISIPDELIDAVAQRLSKLYRGTSSDLLWVRSRAGSAGVSDYLNDLVGRAYALTYPGTRARFADVWNMPFRALGELTRKQDVLDAECARIGRDRVGVRRHWHGRADERGALVSAGRRADEQRTDQRHERQARPYRHGSPRLIRGVKPYGCVVKRELRDSRGGRVPATDGWRGLVALLAKGTPRPLCKSC